MVASRKTVSDIADAILRHVSLDTARNIVNSILQIDGNKSFRDTILLLKKDFDGRSSTAAGGGADTTVAHGESGETPGGLEGSSDASRANEAVGATPRVSPAGGSYTTPNHRTRFKPVDTPDGWWPNGTRISHGGLHGTIVTALRWTDDANDQIGRWYGVNMDGDFGPSWHINQLYMDLI